MTENQQTNDTRKQILDAAKMLLRRYGQDKMTVVDIARALEMSHANVYRFFGNKSEILDAIINEWLSKMEVFIEEIAARPASATERVETIVLELHRRRKKKLLEDPEFYETYRRVVEARPEVVAARRQKVLTVFQRLIEEGQTTGEFGPINPVQAATVLKDATAVFLNPLMIATDRDPNTEKRARHVVKHVLAGFVAKYGKLAEE